MPYESWPEFAPREAQRRERDKTDSYNIEYDFLKKSEASRRSRYLGDVQKQYWEAKELQDIDADRRRKDYEEGLHDIDQYLHYAKEDYIDTLAKTDKNLGEALQKATEWYSADNLFWSGVAKQRTRMITEEGEQIQDSVDTQQEQIEDKYLTGRERAIDKYRTTTKPKEDIQAGQLEDRFSKAKARAPGITSRAEFMTSPEKFRT